GTIAGCYVTDGKITRNAGIRLIRDGIVEHEGEIDSLKRFKDDVREVAQNYECGITIKNYNDIKEGDVIEAFIMEEIDRTRSEEHTSELQSRFDLVCRLLLEKKKKSA